MFNKNDNNKDISQPIASSDIDYEQEEQKLLESLRLVREKKEQAKRIQEEKERVEKFAIPIVFVATEVSGATVIVRNNEFDTIIRNDIVTYLRSVPGRRYQLFTDINGNKVHRNMIPIAEWERFKEHAPKLQNVTVEYENEKIEQDIYNLTHAPKWLVELVVEGVKITPGPRVNTSIIRYNEKLHVKSAKGATEESPAFIINFSEAWLLPEVFVERKSKFDEEERDWVYWDEPIEGVVYTEQALELIGKQLENRAQLDTIAKNVQGYPEIQEALNKKGWNGDFMSFQTTGIKFGMATDGKFILADSVGLGKTWQVLGILTMLERKRILVIVPASLKPNWVREIKNRLGEENVTILTGGDPALWMMPLMFKPTKYTIINYDSFGKKHEEVVPDEEKGWGTKVVKSFPWVDVLKLLPFDALVLDEAHYIKNSSSNRSQAVRKFVEEKDFPTVIPMTGHPVFNRINELWPLLRIVAPGLMVSEDKFIDRYTMYDRKTPYHTDELHELIKPVFLRRRKEDVFKDLPEVLRINEYHDLSAKAKRLYDKVLMGVYEQLREYDPEDVGGAEMNMMHILAKLTRMKQICAADKVDHTVELALECYDSEDDEANSGKKKVLIFSQYKGTAYNITRKLGNEALGFVDRKKHENGKMYFDTVDVDERDRRIQEFQNNPDIHFLVVTEKATREGHNITAAGTVIFNDLFWTPASHEQAEGRAHGRISDMHGINAYYLISEGTFEERIMQILAEKMAIIEASVEGVESARKDVSIVKEIIKDLKNNSWRMR